MARGPKRRYWSRAIVGLAILAVGIGFVGWRFARRPAPPNILLITLDTTRADRLGCYGYASAATPVLDSLAREGVLFENAYTPVPLTLPSHATMLTGLLPPEHGLHLNGQGSLDPELAVLAETFLQKGYSTAAFIASFILDSRFGLDRGFETYDDDLSRAEKGHHGEHRLRSARQIVDSATAWLRAPRDKPFFCWVHLVDPHHPCHEHPAEFGTRFQGRAYDAELAFADTQIARLIEHLRASGELDHTLIVVAGDHGEGLGEHREAEHGYMTYNSTMRVPLLFRLPGLTQAAHRVASPVSLVDLFPTILDCVGIDSPRVVSGRSLKTALRGEELVELPCYGESDAPFAEGGWSPLRCLTTRRWKYIRTTRPELYDLAADPGETSNLAERHPDDLAALEAELASLEGGFERRSAIEAKLSGSERRLLAGLGYVGTPREPTAQPPGTPRRDIKDVIEFPDKVEHAMGMISAGELPQAATMLREIVAAVPDYAKALGTLGVCLSQQQKKDEAARFLEQAVAINPDLDFAQFALGQLLLDRKEYAAALTHFSEALRQNPTAPLSHLLSAEAARKLGDAKSAKIHYEAALQLFPDLTEASVGLGNLALETDDLPAAVERFEAVLRTNPGSAEAHERLALALARQRQYAEAIREYTAAFELAPQNIPAIVGLSRLLSSVDDSSLRNGPKAVRLAERACRLTKSEEFEPLDALAAGLAETEKWNEAVETAEKALAAAQRVGAAEAVAEIAARLERYRRKEPSRLSE